MDPLDWILVIVRWGHALGAVAWVGGGIFYLLVLRPAFRRAPAGDGPQRAIGSEFRGLVNTAIALLIITGIVLSAARLTADAPPPPLMLPSWPSRWPWPCICSAWYGSCAAGPLPIADLAPPDGGPAPRRELTGTTAVLVAGVIVIGLADVLSALFEAGLEP